MLKSEEELLAGLIAEVKRNRFGDGKKTVTLPRWKSFKARAMKYFFLAKIKSRARRLRP